MYKRCDKHDFRKVTSGVFVFVFVLVLVLFGLVSFCFAVFGTLNKNRNHRPQHDKIKLHDSMYIMHNI